MDKQMYKQLIAEYMRRESELKQQVLELTMENAELKDKLMHYPYAQTDGLEVGNPEDYEDKTIYESPDGGETVYRRKFQDYKNREVIKNPKDISEDE